MAQLYIVNCMIYSVIYMHLVYLHITIIVTVNCAITQSYMYMLTLICVFNRVFLAKQFESLQSYCENCIPEARRGFLHQYVSQVHILKCSYLHI